jgi:hypothetical protein
MVATSAVRRSREPARFARRKPRQLRPPKIVAGEDLHGPYEHCAGRMQNSHRNRLYPTALEKLAHEGSARGKQ